MPSDANSVAGPLRLQAVVDSIAATSDNHSIEQTRDRLLRALKDAQLQAPSTSWLDAVAREAVHGHAYIVSGTAILEAQGEGHLGSPLEDAPADLPVTSPAQAGTSQEAAPTELAPERDDPTPSALVNRSRSQARVLIKMIPVATASVLIMTLCRRRRRHRVAKPGTDTGRGT